MEHLFFSLQKSMSAHLTRLDMYGIVYVQETKICVSVCVLHGNSLCMAVTSQIKLSYFNFRLYVMFVCR